MKEEEILQKAIEKAVKNGWDSLDRYSDRDGTLKKKVLRYKKLESVEHLHNSCWEVKFVDKNGWAKDFHLDLNTILFDHDFAIAFFGDKPRLCLKCAGAFPESLEEHKRNSEVEWKYHGQQLYLAKNRLKYISQFL